MTVVTAVNNTTPQPTTSSSLAKNQVDYQTFLTLLVTEMRNQDPTKPMDSTEYVAQLANFSNVEQAIRTNAKLDQILQVSAISQAGSLVGMSMTNADGTITGVVTEIRIFDDGLIAVLEDGQQLVVGAGVSITE